MTRDEIEAIKARLDSGGQWLTEAQKLEREDRRALLAELEWTQSEEKKWACEADAQRRRAEAAEAELETCKKHVKGVYEKAAMWSRKHADVSAELERVRAHEKRRQTIRDLCNGVSEDQP